MAKDYTKSAETALKLLKKFGVLGAFVRNEGITDKTKPWEGETATPINYPAYIALVPMSANDKALMSDSTSEKVMSEAFMDAVEFSESPDVGDKIKHDDILWQIESVQPLKPATVNVVWQMVVSR